MSMIRTLAVLALGLSAAAQADSVFVEGALGRGAVAPGALRLATGDFAGDARWDLVTQRTGSDGDFVEVWERADGPASGFRLGRDIGPQAPVVDLLAQDLDFDGDRDLVVATADPADALVVYLNSPGETPRLRRAPQRFAIAGVQGLRRFFGIASLGAVVVLRGDGQPSRVFEWNGVDGLAPLAQDFPHAGGAHDAVPIYYGDFTEPAALLSLGAAPQRVWRRSGGSYVEATLTGLTRQIRRGLVIDLDPGGGGGLVTAAADGAVEAWLALAPASPNGPPAGYQFRTTLIPAGEHEVRMLDVTRIAGGSDYHLLIGLRDPLTGVDQTRVFEVRPQTLEFIGMDLLDGGTAKAEDSPVFFLADGRIGVRSYEVGPPVPAPAITVSLDPAQAAKGYYAMRGVTPGIDVDLVANLPAPAGFSVPMQSTIGVPAAQFQAGALTARSRGYLVGSLAAGSYPIVLGPPSIAAATLQAPTQTTLTIVEPPPPKPPTQVGPCAVECVALITDLSCSNQAARAKGGAAPAPMGTQGEVQTLRDFRDQVLDESPTGREYIALYREHNDEFIVATFRDPRFYATLWDAKDAWMPAIESLVDGDGSAPIDAAMLEHMDRVFAHYRSHGSRELRDDIAENYARLDPHAFAGQSIGELAAHWAALPSLQSFADGFESP